MNNKPQKPPTIIFNLFGTANKKSFPDIAYHAIVEKVSSSPDGQPLTKLRGCSYIYKGYPRIMRMLDTSKDASWIVADILKKILIPTILFFIFLKPIARRIFIKTCNKYFEIAYKPLLGFIPPEGKQYCPAIREIYNTLQQMIKGIKNERMREVFSKFRDLFLLAVEMDTAYRFKFQDILPTVNVENLKKHPIKELIKMFDLIIERERTNCQTAKWKKVKRAVIFLIRISRKRKRQVIRFFSLLDYDKIRIDETDWYFCLERKDYNYRGWNIEARREERKRIDKERGHKIPIIQIQLPNTPIPKQ